MIDAISVCSRCGESIIDSVFALELEKALPDSVPQELRLCPRCVNSFERWYRKRLKPSFELDRRHQSKLSSALPTALGSTHLKRFHRLRKKVQPHLMFTSITILIFAAAFYWTWTILKRATRVDE